MRWTKQTPSVPGWYWFRYKEGEKMEPVHVFFTMTENGSDLGVRGGAFMYLRGTSDWSGPIPIPENDK